MDYVKTKKNIIETWTPFLTQSFDRYSCPCELKLKDCVTPHTSHCFWHFQFWHHLFKRLPTWSEETTTVLYWLVEKKPSKKTATCTCPVPWCWCRCWQCAEFQYWMLGPPCTHTLNNQTLSQLTHDTRHTFVCPLCRFVTRWLLAYLSPIPISGVSKSPQRAVWGLLGRN